MVTLQIKHNSFHFCAQLRSNKKPITYVEQCATLILRNSLSSKLSIMGMFHQWLDKYLYIHVSVSKMSRGNYDEC